MMDPKADTEASGGRIDHSTSVLLTESSVEDARKRLAEESDVDVYFHIPVLEPTLHTVFSRAIAAAFRIDHPNTSSLPESKRNPALSFLPHLTGYASPLCGSGDNKWVSVDRSAHRDQLIDVPSRLAPRHLISLDAITYVTIFITMSLVQVIGDHSMISGSFRGRYRMACPRR